MIIEEIIKALQKAQTEYLCNISRHTTEIARQTTEIKLYTKELEAKKKILQAYFDSHFKEQQRIYELANLTLDKAINDKDYDLAQLSLKLIEISHARTL